MNFLGSTNKFGLGAEHVIEATVVTAEGNIARVAEHKTTIWETNNRNKTDI